MKATINIGLKNGVLDPQGKAVCHALRSLGFPEVKDVKIGKQIILDIDTEDNETAKAKVKSMCEELLANTVIEDYEIELA